MKPKYCSRPDIRACKECSLTNYNRDCHNNKGEPDIGYNIRQYREGAGLTQTELAEIIGVGQARVADWENNKVEPKASSIIALAKALQVDPGTLLE